MCPALQVGRFEDSQASVPAEPSALEAEEACASAEPWPEDEPWHDACEGAWDNAWAPERAEWVEGSWLQSGEESTCGGWWDDPAWFREEDSFAKPWNCWDYAGDDGQQQAWAEGQGYQWDSWGEEDERWFQGCVLPDPVYGLSDGEEAEAWPNWGPEDEAFFGECRFPWDETKPWNCWDYAGESDDGHQQPEECPCNDGLPRKAPPL